jgi:hypothetical protein
LGIGYDVKHLADDQQHRDRQEALPGLTTDCISRELIEIDLDS